MFKKKAILLSIFMSTAGLSLPVIVQAQLDDPTRPPGYRLALPAGQKAAGVIRYSLSSVRISATRRSAVINDRTVEVGDNIHAAKVVAIYPSSVKLKKQGKVFTVRLLSRISKKVRTQ